MLGSILGAIGGVASSLFGKSQADKNIKMQKEFAQHGIRWKVEDAKAAGLHPLAALGAQTHSFSPIQVGDSWAQAGQDFGRAIDKTRTHPERSESNGVLGKLAVERAQLENDVLRQQLVNSKLATVNQGGPQPAMPVAGTGGQGDADKYIKVEPHKITATDPRIGSGQTPGVIQDITWSKAPNGRYYPMPSHAAKELMEDNFVPQTMHSLRTYTPGSYIGEPYPAPMGMRWTGTRYTGYYLEPAGRVDY